VTLPLTVQTAVSVAEPADAGIAAMVAAAAPATERNANERRIFKALSPKKVLDQLV
jgi:hypothetical protein